MPISCPLRLLCCGLLLLAGSAAGTEVPAAAVSPVEQLAGQRGLVVVLSSSPRQLPLELARRSEAIIYVQTVDDATTARLRDELSAAGLLGTRVYVERGAAARVHLADNLADAAIVSPAEATVTREECLRVVHPQGKVFWGNEVLTKAAPSGIGQWTHPYHGPDNNTQSQDRLARAPYRTQFLAEPWYVPFPEVTVAAGGRVFKAFGHVGFKQRDWPWLNSLVAINGYNGTLLWKRPLEEGFNIHRNTMIATEDALYVADSRSCKVLDPASGEVRHEIAIAPQEGGPVWKWMAIEEGMLYALVGDEEPRDETLRGKQRGAGWPWQPMTRLYDDRNFRWGFGKTLLAIELNTRRIVWRHREDAPIDGRGICMKGGRIYYYSDGRFLACLDARAGKPLWRNDDAPLLEAIGPALPAQSWQNGFSTSSYIKCSDKAVFFAGPQRARLVAASADDGHLLWQHPHGNFQLVLRDEGLYAMGKTGPSLLFDPLSGERRAELPALRGNCTRATGAVDCVYARGDEHGGTLRLTVPDHRPFRIATMRPDCHDGVIIANGLMYWGPWMCDCNLSLVGLIAVGHAGESHAAPADAGQRRETFPRGDDKVAHRAGPKPADWPCYRADNARGGHVPVELPLAVRQSWSCRTAAGAEWAAPIAVGGRVYLSGSSGTIEARDAATGDVRWKAHTGGPILFPPAVAGGRLFAGSGDGWVYAFAVDDGRPLWRFRAASEERKMMTYGRLTSTWPVASGVLVAGDTVYAAAGIAGYDGTYVYALDAATGTVRWANEDSARLHGPEHFTGVSVQGHLLLDGERLYLAGGNVVSPAIYQTSDGRCLNTLPKEWVKAPRGRDLFRIAGQVTAFDRLLYAPKEYWPGRYYSQNFLQVSSEAMAVRSVDGRVMRVASDEPDGKSPKALWQYGAFAHVNAMAMGSNAVLIAGELTTDDREKHSLVALALDDGRPLWREPLPAMPVQSGIAIDGAGRIVVAIEDGETIVYSARQD